MRSQLHVSAWTAVNCVYAPWHIKYDDATLRCYYIRKHELIQRIDVAPISETQTPYFTPSELQMSKFGANNHIRSEFGHLQIRRRKIRCLCRYKVYTTRIRGVGKKEK